MIRHNQAPERRSHVPQLDVAATLPTDLVSQPLKSLHRIAGRRYAEGRSIGAFDLDYLFLDRRRHGVPVGSQAFEVKADRFLDVLQGFAARLALRDAAWQRRYFGNKLPIFICLNQNTIFHPNLAPATFYSLKTTGSSA